MKNLYDNFPQFPVILNLRFGTWPIPLWIVLFRDTSFPSVTAEKKGIFSDVLPQRGSIILAIPSHKSSAFYPSLRQGNEPEAKGLPPEGWCLQKTPSGGDIFVEKCTVYRITPGRGEIFFNKSTLGKEIVRSLRSESLLGISDSER